MIKCLEHFVIELNTLFFITCHRKRKHTVTDEHLITLINTKYLDDDDDDDVHQGWATRCY